MSVINGSIQGTRLTEYANLKNNPGKQSDKSDEEKFISLFEALVLTTNIMVPDVVSLVSSTDTGEQKAPVLVGDNNLKLANLPLAPDNLVQNLEINNFPGLLAKISEQEVTHSGEYPEQLMGTGDETKNDTLRGTSGKVPVPNTEITPTGKNPEQLMGTGDGTKDNTLRETSEKIPVPNTEITRKGEYPEQLGGTGDGTKDNTLRETSGKVLVPNTEITPTGKNPEQSKGTGGHSNNSFQFASNVTGDHVEQKNDSLVSDPKFKDLISTLSGEKLIKPLKEMGSEGLPSSGQKQSGPESSKGRPLDSLFKEVTIVEEPGQLAVSNDSQTAKLSLKSGISEKVMVETLPDRIGDLFQKVPQDKNSRTWELKLEPEKLGKLKITINWSQGKISADFLTETSQAAKVLEQSLDILKQNLVQKNIDVSSLSIMVFNQERRDSGSDMPKRERRNSSRDHEPQTQGQVSGDSISDELSINFLV